MIIAKLHPAQGPQHGTSVSSYMGNSQQLTHQGIPDLGYGLAEEASKTFIPGSVGAGLIGGVVDSVSSKVLAMITKSSPTLGVALKFITDSAAWLLEQVNWTVKANSEGVIRYLPDSIANTVLNDMRAGKGTIFEDALKDALAAIHYRIAPLAGMEATNLKQGRDTILLWIYDFVLKAFSVDAAVYSRLADRIYTAAKGYGAQDYEAAAAAAYALMVGTQMPSILPTGGIHTDIYGIPVNIEGNVECNKRVSSIPASKLDQYLAMVGPNPKRTVDWLQKAYDAKSGGLSGGGTAAQAGLPAGSTSSAKSSLPVLPLLAGGAVLLVLMSNKKKSS